MFTIERYTEKDKAAVVNMFRRHVPEYFAAHEEEDLLLFLDNYAQEFFLCKDGDVIAACGGHNIEGSHGKLSWYITQSEYMGKGAGSMLVHYNLQALKDAGVNRITVRTSQLADSFYVRFGFELLNIKKDYWSKGLDLYEMELPNWE